VFNNLKLGALTANTQVQRGPVPAAALIVLKWAPLQGDESADAAGVKKKDGGVQEV